MLMKWQVRELWPGLAGKRRQVDTNRGDLVMSSRMFREDVHFMHIKNGSADSMGEVHKSLLGERRNG